MSTWQPSSPGKFRSSRIRSGSRSVGIDLVAQAEQVIEGVTPVGDDRQAMRHVAFAERALDDLGVGATVFDQQDVKLRSWLGSSVET